VVDLWQQSAALTSGALHLLPAGLRFQMAVVQKYACDFVH